MAALSLMHFEAIAVADTDELDPSSGPREVPFIAKYRKELVHFPAVLNYHDLWLVYHWDRK